jgi:hypothetical protein
MDSDRVMRDCERVARGLLIEKILPRAAGMIMDGIEGRNETDMTLIGDGYGD